MNSGVIEGLAFLVVMAVLGTAVLTKRAVRKPKIVPSWVPTLIAGVVVTAVLAASCVIVYIVLVFQRENCLTRVQGRNDTRTFDFVLVKVVDAGTGTTRYTTEQVAPDLPSLVGAVPKQLFAKDCPKHP